MGTPKWVRIDRNSDMGRLGRFQMNLGNAAEVWCSSQKEEDYLTKKSLLTASLPVFDMPLFLIQAGTLMEACLKWGLSK